MWHTSFEEWFLLKYIWDSREPFRPAILHITLNADIELPTLTFEWQFNHLRPLQFCEFESHPSNMPVIFFHRTRESTEYTVLTHIGVWVKTKINILYPRCKFNNYGDIS